MKFENRCLKKVNETPKYSMGKKRKILCYSCLLIFILIAYGCSSRSEYAGIYRTEETPDQPVSELELKDDGEGIWRFGDYEETFIWYAKRKEIRLNTKKGAVIVADIQNNTLFVTLSGGKRLSLKKVE